MLSVGLWSKESEASLDSLANPKTAFEPLQGKGELRTKVSDLVLGPL